MKIHFFMCAFAVLVFAGCATYPVVGSFDNFREVFEGQVNHNLFSGGGTIKVHAVESDVHGEGTAWITHVPNRFAHAGQGGEAKILFEDGRIVSAQWHATSLTTGIGEGQDQYGNHFTFRFGMTRQEATNYVARRRLELADKPVPPAGNRRSMQPPKKKAAPTFKGQVL